jgi:hypothetical protein
MAFLIVVTPHSNSSAASETVSLSSRSQMWGRIPASFDWPYWCSTQVSATRLCRVMALVPSVVQQSNHSTVSQIAYWTTHKCRRGACSTSEVYPPNTRADSGLLTDIIDKKLTNFSYCNSFYNKTNIFIRDN